jgi:hypothetical protein
MNKYGFFRTSRPHEKAHSPLPSPRPPVKLALSLGSRESVILYLGIEAGGGNPDPVEAVQREGHQVLIPFTTSAANMGLFKTCCATVS